MEKNNLHKKQHGKPGNPCRAVLLTAAVLLGGLSGTPGLLRTVAAAEPAPNAASGLAGGNNPVQITEFGVSQEDEGIFAYCVYQEYDKSGGMMQLYLERMDEQGEFLPVSYADLSATGKDPLTIRTAPENPVLGTYKAVLLIRGGAGTPVVRFRDSAPYEVKEEGENINGAQAGAGAQSGANEPDPPGKQNLCEHTITENLLREADPAHDAVMAECCKECGQVFSCFEVPNSAYAAFLKQAAEKIRSAPPDSLVVIDTDRWVSFNHWVLDAIGVRRDLSILVKYRYQGSERQTFVPSGTDIPEFADENGFCGFCRMADLISR